MRVSGGTTRACLLVLATTIAAACGATRPSTEPTTGAGAATACIGLEVGQCELVLAALAPRLPGVPASYVVISERLCDGPCPGEERGLWLGHVLVEFRDGRKPETILIEVDGDVIDWEPTESALGQLNPQSPRITQPTIELTLGHCGVGSGIDVDGSFWNPIGMIEATDQALTSSVDARFSLTSPVTASLVTASGSVFQLVRHQGPKYLFGCD